MTYAALDKKYLRPAMIIFSENQPLQLTASVTAIAKTDTNTKIQYTTSTAHGFSVGDYVTIAGTGIGNFAFSTQQLITDITATSPHTFKIASTNTGTSAAATATNHTRWELGTNYLYITDDGRSDLSVSNERIEYSQRMINGRMRKYHVVDKKSFSTSWVDLPSRKTRAGSVSDGRTNTITSDGYAAGTDIKEWYETYTGDFWTTLVFDSNDTTTSLVNTVSVHNVFFDSFNFNVVKRGQFNDLWNVDISLVEV
jgi:hypothetical protein